MSLFYPKHKTIPLIGTKIVTFVNQTVPTEVITPATLTATYAGNISSALRTGGFSQINLNVQYKVNNTNNILNLKFEWSGDQEIAEGMSNTPVNWFQESAEISAIGTTSEYLQVRKFDNNAGTVSGTTYSFRLVVPTTADHFFRVSVQETGGGVAGTVYVEAVMSGK